MKYNININSVKMKEHNLNINQWLILDIISISQAWCDIVSFEGDFYYWISRSKIKEELKTFNLKEDTIYRHLKNLDNLGFIQYKKDNKKDLIKLTELGKSLFMSSGMNPNNKQNSEMNPRKLGNESEKNSEMNPTYNNTRINNNTKINKEKDKKESNKDHEQKNKRGTLFDLFLKENPNLEEIEKQYANKFIEYRKEIKKPLKTTSPINAFLEALITLNSLGYSFEYSFGEMKSHEWQTLKPEYIHKTNKTKNSSNGYQTKHQRNMAKLDEYYELKAQAKRQQEEQKNEYIEDTEIL